MIGKKILHYKILEEIGRGGMGVVYKAEDTRLNRTVAIKFMPSEIARSDVERQRFKLEAQAAAALSHPNIGHIYSIEELGDELFIVMEYIEGRELREIIKTAGRVAVNDAINYAVQIARGLQAAHKKDIVHRDIKSSNILMTGDGRVKIMDFGLAKLGGGADLTKDHSTLGTAKYMSPEQARGEPTDKRADIWSFGVVLYEMLTGQPPFTGEYDQAVIYSILNEKAPDINTLRSDLPRGLTSIISKTLEKDASKRFQSTEDLIDALEAVEKSGNIESATAKKGMNLPRMALVIGIPLVLFLAFIGVRALKSPTETTPSTASDRNAIAVLPFSVRGTTEFDYLGEGMVDLLSTKLDGAGGWRSIDPRAILAQIEGSQGITPQQGRDIAQRLSASFYVLGNVLEASGKLQIHASLYDLNENHSALTQGTAQGQADRIFELVDEIAAQLLVIESDAPSERVTQIAGMTTHSLPALKAYLEGEKAFREGQFTASFDAFNRAVSADTAFALAWYRLSLAAEWSARSGEAHDAAIAAFQHSSRLSQHDKLLLEAFSQWRNGDAQAAERLYRTIVGLYPDDVEAWFQLGEVLFHHGPFRGRPISESRSVWERVLKFEPNHLHALWHLARIPARAGNIEELSELVNRIEKLNPAGDRILEILTLEALVSNNTSAKSETMARLRSSSDATLVLAAWNTATYLDDPLKSFPVAELLTDDSRSIETRSMGHIWLAYLELMRGHLKQAETQLNAADNVVPNSSLIHKALFSILPFYPVREDDHSSVRHELFNWQADSVPPSKNPGSYYVVHDGLHPHLRAYLLAMIDANAKNQSAARLMLREFDNLVAASDRWGSLIPDLRLSIQAQIALSENKSSEALKYLEMEAMQIWYNYTFASPFFSQALDRYNRAELMNELRRYDEAIHWYGSFEENSVYDLIYLAPSHLRRAEIFEKQGNADLAIEHYERFIALWQGCDPELMPLVYEAKRKLAMLKDGD